MFAICHREARMKSDLMLRPLLVNSKQARKLLGNISKKTFYNWTSEFHVSPIRRGYFLTSDIIKLVDHMKKRNQIEKYVHLKKLGLD